MKTNGIFLNRLKYLLSPQLDTYRAILPFITGKHTLLDCGCGTGAGSLLLSRYVSRVYAIDPDPEMIAFGQSIFHGKNVEYFNYEFDKAAAEASADAVVAIDVLEHLDNPVETVLQPALKALKKGGIFIASTPNRLCRYRKSDNHVREYSPGEFRELVGSVFGLEWTSAMDINLAPLDQEGMKNPIISFSRRQ